MSGYGTAHLLALLPAAGIFLRGVLAEMVNVSQRTLSLSLHVAAGVVLAVAGIELVPEALEIDRPWRGPSVLTVPYPTRAEADRGKPQAGAPSY